MLKNIKSTYFIQLIYIHIDESQKLKIIKCNKKLQKNINISIINYKYFQKKYIIYESNGIAEEYDGYFDTLIYDGQYLNGQRHGRGKIYNKDYYLEFDGEFLNGKRNGKGKEYDYDTLKFDGEYLNRKRHGKGKEYNYNGRLRFEGEYLNGKEWIGTRYNYNGKMIFKLDNNINGKGKEYDEDGKLEYEGEYKNSKRNGKGKEYWNDHLIFEGEYLNDLKWNGIGYDLSNNITFEIK